MKRVGKMPPAPPKPCARCHRNLTIGTYCKACQEIMEAKPIIEYRATATERGYNGQWKKIRDLKIKRNPLCERCYAKGFVVKAVLVHHKDRNPRNNESGNHESLCNHCHALEHRFDKLKVKIEKI